MTRNRLVLGLVAVLVTTLIGGAALVLKLTVLRPTTVIAYFTSATAIYPGDQVRIAGVKVGTIDSIEPDGTQARMTLHVEHAVKLPADAKAVVVAQNLVSARYVQLTPGYRSGPRMRDGAVIPVERTAVPVEWDQVKDQLTRLATELGPEGNMSTGSAGRFINSAADALDGNGDKLRQTLAQLSGVGRILADGSGDIVSTIANLQTFVSALRDSNQQIEQFQDRLASLSSVLNGSRSDLDTALTKLSDVVSDVQRFIADTRDKSSEQIQRLANVTQNIVDHRKDFEQLLHVAAPSLANAYNMMDPRTGGAGGTFVLSNLSDPSAFICDMITAIGNVTAAESGKLCSQYLGPALRLPNFNYLPIPVNPILSSRPPPGALIYSEPQLAPGGESSPPDPGAAPAVSAYTGTGDVPAPPGYGPLPSPIAAPLPGAASAPVGVPQPQPPTLRDMLLPAEQAPGPAPATQPAQGAPPP